jgi:class 3 adenylate cyclase
VHGEGPVDVLVMRAWHSNLDHEWREPVLAGILSRLGSVGRVIRLDRRGTGMSDRFDLATPPTLEHRIDDIRATLDAVGSDRVVVIGLAHAGALCCFFAATYPERTAALVLWSSPPSMLGQVLPQAFDAYRDSLRQGWASDEAARETAQVAGLSRATDEAFVDWLREDARLSGSAEELATQWELVRETNVEGILSSIHVPTLVLWRSEAPTVAAEVAARIPGAERVELPGRDHMLIAGDWRTPLAEIERFVESRAGIEQATDRVLATVVFTDLVGATHRAAELGDRSWRELLERHHTVVRTELARHRGREIDTAGDGFFAAFDSPARAIRCAVSIRSAITHLNLDVRIGLHAGECERVGNGLRGVAVHIGARISALADSGEILVSSTVRDLVAGSGIRFENAGSHALKGLPDRWLVYRVVDVDLAG